MIAENLRQLQVRMAELQLSLGPPDCHSYFWQYRFTVYE